MSGCGPGSETPGWKSSGVLRIGTDATYPPFEMVNTETGNPEGFDIDIISAVCRINGWEPEFIITPFDGIISGLKSDKYDCIISAMTITPQRKAIVLFSEPYYLAGQVIAVPQGDTIIHSTDDLRGRKVGVQLGTTGERMAKSLPGVSVFSFDNIGAAFIDMENGRIDAVLNDFPTTTEYIRLKGRAKIVGDLLSEEYYGIAVARKNIELLEKINTALRQIKTDGEYDKIAACWFPGGDFIRPDSSSEN
nr:basic amino acid ABC transporter substrate-binding protein [candidate division Zixibacteria bacterium]